MTLINEPALTASILMACLCTSLGIVSNLEAAGRAVTTIRVLTFCCIALACLVGIVWCVLSSGGGIL